MWLGFYFPGPGLPHITCRGVTGVGKYSHAWISDKLGPIFKYKYVPCNVYTEKAFIVIYLRFKLGHVYYLVALPKEPGAS